MYLEFGFFHQMLNLEKTDLKAEIVALQAKLAEAEILVVQTQEEKNKLALSQAAIHDCFEVDGDMQPGHHVKNGQRIYSLN
jgi:hypothetical protein